MTAPLTDKPTVQQILKHLVFVVQYNAPISAIPVSHSQQNSIDAAIANAAEQIRQQERERVETLVKVLLPLSRAAIVSENFRGDPLNCWIWQHTSNIPGHPSFGITVQDAINAKAALKELEAK